VWWISASLELSASTAPAEPTQVLALAGSIDQVVTNIRTWLMGILVSLASVSLSIGGVRYVMGGGDPGEIEKAKTVFKSAALGLRPLGDRRVDGRGGARPCDGSISTDRIL
jgi:hypothetical protein